MRFMRAFTLIELLIVVAIIAILAAIAVPNFLEAQVRAKVSRVYGELRTYATAYEAYKVDHNRYPREYDVNYGDRLYFGESIVGRNGWWISTPIAYLSTAFLTDPFVPYNTQKFEQLYTYQNLVDRAENRTKGRGPTFTAAFTDLAIPFYGDWRAGSYGPDKQFGVAGVVNSGQMTYDATNGTISSGQIWRCQARGENTQPPIGNPGLLGPH
jgi:prepilin-type N-terminal cleavage/methylation domain-containing protein